MSDRYVIRTKRYNRWFEEIESVVATGQIKEQMELLFESYQKLGMKEDYRNFISLSLYDTKEEKTLAEHTR